MNPLSVLLSARLPGELLAAAALFFPGVARRPRFFLRLAGGGLMLLLPGLGLYLFLALPALPWAQSPLAGVLVYSLLSYLALFLLVWLCCSLTALEALYCATCAYLVQHFAYCFFTLFFPASRTDSWCFLDLRYGLIYLLVYWAAWRLFARPLSRSGWGGMAPRRAVGTTVSALSIALVLSALGQELADTSLHLYNLLLVYSMVCCFYILWDQVGQQRQLALQRQLDFQEQVWRQHKAQYQLSAETVALIDRKCHDLKHQIAALRAISDQAQRERSIAELEQSVMIYDSMVETGNQILDTVLTEKSLLCEARGITLTCVADGACLDFMDPVDLYTLFGNALDNAMESVSALEDLERRTIAVLVFSRADLVVLQLENYCGQSRHFSGDLLPTTKKEEPGYHGFGLRSIRCTAEKYGGFLTIQQEEDIFLLRVTIPRFQ